RLGNFEDVETRPANCVGHGNGTHREGTQSRRQDESGGTSDGRAIVVSATENVPDPDLEFGLRASWHSWNRHIGDRGNLACGKNISGGCAERLAGNKDKKCWVIHAGRASVQGHDVACAL